MNKNLELITPMLLLALMLFVSGCVNVTNEPVVKDDKILDKPVNKEPVGQDQSKSTSTEPIEKIEGEIKYLVNGEVDTSDWVTYRNEKYGFEIRHPKFWTTADAPELNRIHFYNDGIKRLNWEPTGPSTSLLIQKLDNDNAIKSEENKPKNVFVNGYEAIEFEEVRGSQDSIVTLSFSNHYYINKNGSLYRIMFYTHWFEGEDYKLKPIIDKKVYDLILNSFKIL
jgi:hypothetical protein